MNTSTMNRFAIALPLCVLMGSAMAQNKNVAINNDGAPADPSGTAIFDVQSNYAGIQKGMYIPRMTVAERTGMGVGLADGLTVYVNDLGNPASNGFWTWDAPSAAWYKVAYGANAWELTGNDLNNGNPAADFFGTTDNQSIAFRTSTLERMRLMGTTGYLGVNTTTPQERLDVNGALRIYVPAPPESALHTQGTIRFQPPTDTMVVTGATLAPFPSTLNGAFVPLLWSGHWGNINGGVPTPAGANPLPGGWRRMENDYDEIFNAAYTQQGQMVCSSGAVNIPNGNPTTFTNALPAATQEMVSPFLHNAVAKRWRHQHLFLKSELNVELNQLSGNPNETGGLCPGQAVDSIAFYINTPIAAAQQKLWQYQVAIKHAPLGVNNLFLGFDNSVDGAGVCVANAGGTAKPTPAGPAGWYWFRFNSPFVWDGARNIIIDIAVSSGNASNPGILPVGYATIGGASPANQLTYSAWTLPAYGALGAPCNPNVTNNACGVTVIAANLPTTGCGTFGSTNYRPAVRFAGGIATAPVATSGTGAYLLYKGGFIAEMTQSLYPWGRWIQGVPAGHTYNVFKGPGNISSEKGVYDNGVKLNDHVFDRAFDGRVKAADAAEFGSGRNYSIDEMAEFTKGNRHLPTVRGRAAWQKENGFSLGEMTNQLWVTSETHALYLAELHDQLNVLELLSTNRPISLEEGRIAEKAIAGMGDLTEAEKAALLVDLKARTTEVNNVKR